MSFILLLYNPLKSGAIWQSSFAVLGIVGLFLPGSPYQAYSNHESLIDDGTYNGNGTFWLRCPPGKVFKGITQKKIEKNIEGVILLFQKPKIEQNNTPG